MEIKWIRVGQERPYGDTHRECVVTTNEEIPEGELLNMVHNGDKLPKDVFDSKFLTAMEYFTGYYTLEKTGQGYHYHGVEPYCD